MKTVKNNVSYFVHGIEIGLKIAGWIPNTKHGFGYDNLELVNMFVKIMRDYETKEDANEALEMVLGKVETYHTKVN